MDLKISNNLIDLAKIFKKNNFELFVVGGFVRNSLIGLPLLDVDICSKASYQFIESFLKNTKYSIKLINEKLGTCLIQIDKEQYEYTPFRKEIYDSYGVHSPSKVNLGATLEEDADRRDFTINCIYYNILTKTPYDKFNGIQDIKLSTLKCIKTPEAVFCFDGLRILRLIRFALELNFKINNNTLKYAIKYSYGLTKISAERKSAEIKKIVIADLIYNSNNQKLFELFNKLNLLKYIFCINEKFDIKKIKQFNFYATYEMERYLAFCLIIIINHCKYQYSTQSQILFIVHKLFGENGLKESTELKQNIVNLYTIFQDIYFSKQSFETFIKYTNLNTALTNILQVFCGKKYNDFVDQYNSIKKNNIPLNKSHLKISATDIIELGINPKFVSKIQEVLLNLCISMQIKNEKTELIKTVQYLDKNFKEMANKKDK